MLEQGDTKNKNFYIIVSGIVDVRVRTYPAEEPKRPVLRRLTSINEGFGAEADDTTRNRSKQSLVVGKNEKPQSRTDLARISTPKNVLGMVVFVEGS